jgi:hypothetical protein
MIGRSACQLKSRLERPEGIDNSQWQVAPLGFIKRFQSVNTRFLELRVHKTFQQSPIERARSFSQDDAAVAIAKIIQLRREVSLDDRRSFTGDRLAHVLFIYIHEFQLLAV